MAEQDLPGPGQNSKDTNKQLTTAITARVWERFMLWLLTFPLVPTTEAVRLRCQHADLSGL